MQVLVQVVSADNLVFFYLEILKKWHKLLLEPNSQNVINPPKNIEHTIYVDGINGRDWKDGKTEGTALKTIQKAMKNVQSGTQIIVKNGNYQNYKFGSGKKLLKSYLRISHV